jgi:putative tryptophan/tyrosine transport system substrate-binding protein
MRSTLCVTRYNMTNNPVKSRFLTLIVCVFIAALLFSGFYIWEKNRSKVFHVGILSGVENFSPTIVAFKSEMKKLGYLENKNIFYDARQLSIDPQQEKAISEEFVKNKTDLILAFPTEAALAAKKAAANSKTTVVFAWCPTEDNGLIESVSRPGGNITGIRFSSNDFLAKTYDLLLEMAPDTKRIWMIYSPHIPAAADFVKIIKPAAQSDGVTIIETTDIINIDELKISLQNRAKLADIGVDAIMFLPDGITPPYQDLALLSEFAKNHKIPLAGLTSEQVGSGVLFGYGPTVSAVSKLAANQVDKIFKGAKAGDLPAVTVEGSLWIDYRVAREIGLTIPEGILSQAEKIIR